MAAGSAFGAAASAGAAAANSLAERVKVCHVTGWYKLSRPCFLILQLLMRLTITIRQLQIVRRCR